MPKVKTNRSGLVFEDILSIGDNVVVYPQLEIAGYREDSHSFCMQQKGTMTNKVKIFYIFAECSPFNLKKPEFVYAEPDKVMKKIDDYWYKMLIKKDFEDTGLITWVPDPHADNLGLLKNSDKPLSKEEEASRTVNPKYLPEIYKYIEENRYLELGSIRGTIESIFLHKPEDSMIVRYESYNLLYSIQSETSYRCSPKNTGDKTYEILYSNYIMASLNVEGMEVYIPITFLLKKAYYDELTHQEF